MYHITKIFTFFLFLLGVCQSLQFQSHAESGLIQASNGIAKRFALPAPPVPAKPNHLRGNAISHATSFSGKSAPPVPFKPAHLRGNPIAKRFAAPAPPAIPHKPAHLRGNPVNRAGRPGRIAPAVPFKPAHLRGNPIESS